MLLGGENMKKLLVTILISLSLVFAGTSYSFACPTTNCGAPLTYDSHIYTSLLGYYTHDNYIGCIKRYESKHKYVCDGSDWNCGGCGYVYKYTIDDYHQNCGKGWIFDISVWNSAWYEYHNHEII